MANNRSILSVVESVSSDLMEDISIRLFILVFLLCLLHMEAERRWGRRNEPSKPCPLEGNSYLGKATAPLEAGAPK